MPASAPYPDTFPELLVQGYRRGGDRTAVAYRDRTLSFSEIDARSERLAAGLHGVGIERGDRIGVLVANRLESPVIDAAIARAGAVRIPLNPRYSRREVEHVLMDADADAIIVDQHRAAVLEAVSADVSALENTFVFGEPPTDRFEPVDILWSEGPDAVPAPDRSPEAPAAIYYTGGTTGEPKGVVYSNRVLVRNLLAHLAEFEFGSSDIGLLTTPLSHSAGTFLTAGLLAGGRVVVQDGFDVTQAVDAIQDRGVTWTMLVPTILYRLLAAGDSATKAVRRLDRIYYGTAPIRPSKLRQAVERFGPTLVQFYGQTEVPNLVTTFAAAAHERAVAEGDLDRLQSAGTPALQSAIKIIDPETGVEQPTGNAGEAVVSAPYSFDRYLDRPDDTMSTLRDGWVHTGDIGYLDDEGYLYLLDRQANTVNTGGLNVYPREIESALSDHRAVADVAVIGIPDEEWGEAVHGVVVTASAESVSEGSLIEFVGERLAGYKKPKSIEFRDELPRTSLGKIDREALRDEYWVGRDRSIQ